MVLDMRKSSRDPWADRGRHDTLRERWLRQIGWRPYIKRKDQAGRPIGEHDKARNRRIASLRGPGRTHLRQPGADGKTIRGIGLPGRSLSDHQIRRVT